MSLWPRTAEHSFTKTVSIDTEGPIEVHFGQELLVVRIRFGSSSRDRLIQDDPGALQL